MGVGEMGMKIMRELEQWNSVVLKWKGWNWIQEGSALVRGDNDVMYEILGGWLAIYL